MVDSRAIVEAVDVGFRHEADEIVVASLVLGVKAKMVAAFVLVARRVVAGRGHIGLATQYRLYGRQLGELLLRRTAGVVERLKREKVAVVCDGKRWHTPFSGTGDQRIDLALPVQKRVCRVQVKMDEVAHLNQSAAGTAGASFSKSVTEAIKPLLALASSARAVVNFVLSQ